MFSEFRQHYGFWEMDLSVPLAFFPGSSSPLGCRMLNLRTAFLLSQDESHQPSGTLRRSENWRHLLKGPNAFLAKS